MAEAAFDTLAAARALKDAGVKPEHAEAIADVVKSYQRLQTRTDKYLASPRPPSRGLPVTELRLLKAPDQVRGDEEGAGVMVGRHPQ